MKNPNYETMSTRLHGVSVEVDFEQQPDGSYASMCFLSKTTDEGEYTGSLALCQDRGGIPYEQGTGPDEGPEVYQLSDQALDDIERWAVEHGY